MTSGCGSHPKTRGPISGDPREVPPPEAERRLRARGRSRAAARLEMARIEALAEAAGYRRLRRRGEGTASDLARDFGWLYRRVHGETSAAIAAADGDPTLESVVHRATTRLAGYVGIRLRGWDRTPTTKIEA